MIISVPIGAQTGKIELESNGATSISLDDLVVTNLSTTPPVPQNLQVSLDNGNIKITWDYFSDLVEKFEVERAANNNPNSFELVTELNQSSRSYNDTQASTKTRQYYRVRALNIRGASPYSNTIIFDPAVLSNADPIVIYFMEKYPHG